MSHLHEVSHYFPPSIAKPKRHYPKLVVLPTPPLGPNGIHIHSDSPVDYDQFTSITLVAETRPGEVDGVEELLEVGMEEGEIGEEWEEERLAEAAKMDFYGGEMNAVPPSALTLLDSGIAAGAVRVGDRLHIWWVLSNQRFTFLRHMLRQVEIQSLYLYRLGAADVIKTLNLFRSIFADTLKGLILDCSDLRSYDFHSTFLGFCRESQPLAYFAMRNVFTSLLMDPFQTFSDLMPMGEGATVEVEDCWGRSGGFMRDFSHYLLRGPGGLTAPFLVFRGIQLEMGLVEASVAKWLNKWSRAAGGEKQRVEGGGEGTADAMIRIEGLPHCYALDTFRRIGRSIATKNIPAKPISVQATNGSNQPQMAIRVRPYHNSRVYLALSVPYTWEGLLDN